jgi:dUTP pyrophosphatase
MANSEGIIDRTYRGPIKAPVKMDDFSGSYIIDEGVRLFQIVAPDLGHIKEIVIVEKLPETERGEGGFGSTGK